MARILVVTTRWPFPVRGGDSLRILEICREFAKKHEVQLIACTDSRRLASPGEYGGLFQDIEAVYIPAWRSYLGSAVGLASSKPLQLAYYASERMRYRVAERARGANVIVAHLIRAAQFVPMNFEGLTVLEMTDAISMGYGRLNGAVKQRLLLSSIYRIEYSRMREAEQAYMRRFDHTFVVSAIDRDYLCSQDPMLAGRVRVAPNGVSTDRFAANPRLEGREILFIGNMRTLPNTDAVVHFVHSCLPRIRDAATELVFRVVGPTKPGFVRMLESMSDGVIVTGEVDDLSSTTVSAFCAVAPMRLGAGMQNKVLDYLALGLPCVTTSVGYEGLEAQVGKEILVADDPNEMAAAVLCLHRNRELRRRIGLAGSRYVAAHHFWPECLAPFVELVDAHEQGDKRCG